MKHGIAIFVLIIWIVPLTGSAIADLVVEISGAPGGTFTTWQFSGSSSTSVDGTTGESRIEWTSPYDFTSIQNTSITASTGAVTISGTALTSPVTTDTVYIDDDATGDDIGLAGPAVTSIPYVVGTISWSGTLQVPVSIDEFDNTPLPADFTEFGHGTSINSSPFLFADLDLNIRTTNIPEPGTFAMFTLFSALALTVRKRNSQHFSSEYS